MDLAQLPVRTAKITASTQSNQSSHGTMWVAKDSKHLQADSDDWSAIASSSESSLGAYAVS